jgi:putative N6-adenine-specific DNA methylase
VKLYSDIGTNLKNKYQGRDDWLISSNNEALKMIGLKPQQKLILFNGALECRFQKFSMYEGSKKVSKAGTEEGE